MRPRKDPEQATNLQRRVGFIAQEQWQGAGGVISLGSRGVTEDVELPKELTPVTSHSIAFVEATLLLRGPRSIR